MKKLIRQEETGFGVSQVNDNYVLNKDGKETFEDLPNGIVKPTIEEGKFIESATQEEIDSFNKTKLSLEKEEQISQSLKQGIEISGYKFTEQTLVKFITATDLSEKLGATTIKWQKADRTIVELTIQEARQIQAQGFVMFQNIYFN